jgi:uncharacterized protein involved in outer membrane biogenesis
MFKNIFRILLMVAGLAAITLLCLTVLLKIFFPEQQIKWFALNMSKFYLNREPSFGRIKYEIPGNIDIKQFSLSEEPGFKNGTFVSIEDLLIKPRVLPMLHKKLEFGGITARSFVLNVARNKSGTLNFPGFREPGPRGLNIYEKLLLSSLMVSEFRIDGGKVNYSDLGDRKHDVIADSLALELKSVSLSHPFDFKTSFALENALAQKVFDVEGAGTIDISSDTITIEKAVFKHGKGRLFLSGSIGGFFGRAASNSTLKVRGDEVLLEEFFDLTGLAQNVSITEQSTMNFEIKVTKDKVLITKK